MRKLWKCLWQVGLFIVVAMIGNEIAHLFHLKISGSILGIFIIFALLHFKIIRLEWVESGANWLLAELLLFFVPSAVGIIKYKNLMAADGVQFLLIIVVSTIIVMACTGLVAEILSKRKGASM